MELTYNLDVDARSSWLLVTPNLEAQSLLFHVSEAGHFHAGPGFFTDREGKEEYYLLYTQSGTGVLRHLGQTLLLRPHHAILIYCREPHFYATRESPWDHYWLHFNGPAAQTYYDLVNEDGISDVYIEDAQAFRHLLKETLNCSDVLDRRQSVLSAMYVTQLLSMMVVGRHTLPPDGLQAHHQEKLDQAISHLQEHFHEQVRLEDLAAVAHLSVSHFMRIFKQYTGMAPHAYLINYRVNQAKKILRSTTIPISDVAFQVGFQDESNFSRTFRRIAGTTPLNFRKMRC